MEQKNKELIIFLAGEIQNKDSLIKLIQSKQFDFYAADGGYTYAKDLGISLKWVLGDFDSVKKPNIPNILTYPKEKDETDAELALRLAVKEGYDKIWMIAPFGGRLDHTIANLQLLETAIELGVSLKLYDGKNLVFLLDRGKHRIEKYRYISFFPWDQSATVSLHGFKYPLEKYSLIRSKPIGISNEPLEEFSIAEVHCGNVLCVCVENDQEDL